jgi:peptide subunit release factor 1 (eRF1)
VISRGDVERLSERASTPGSPVLSVYLDVDQSRAVNLNREYLSALKARLRAVEQQLIESDREAFRADAARVERHVAQYRPHAKTLVLFADDSADLFWSGELRVALPTEVRWEPTPHVRPLLEVLDEHERYGVVLLDKERARLFTVFLGEIEEEREILAAGEVRHKKSSGTDHLRSAMQFQRQDETHVHWYLREVVELIEDVTRERAFDRLVLAGPVEVTSELARMLPHPLGEHVAGTLRLPVHATADEVLRHTLEIAERAERETEKTRVAQLFERGAVGLEKTLLALQEGRLWMLLYADGFATSGAECPRCSMLSASRTAANCSYCGERLLPLDDLIGRMLERASSGFRVEKVHGEAAERLRAAGGIGAILRF